MACTGRLRPKGVEVSLVQGDGREGNLSFRSVKRLKKGHQISLMYVKKSGKRSRLVIYSYCKNSAFTAVEGMQSSRVGM